MEQVRHLAWMVVALLPFWATTPAQDQPSAGPADELLAVFARVQHVPRGPELSVSELTIDPSASPRDSVTAERAREDVARFFHLLEHGYCGYGWFGGHERFASAELAILDDLRARERWPTAELARRIRTRLDFVRDAHLRLGDVTFSEHQDFWWAEGVRLIARDGREFVRDENGDAELLAVNGGDPSPFVFASLDATGMPAVRLGTLSRTRPASLQLRLSGPSGVFEQDAPLRRSTYRRAALFDEFRLGGLPVVRIKTFSDHHDTEIDAFLRTAEELRGEPCVLIDLRGNGGGNTRWPRAWIQRFTGRTPELGQVLTELITRTALVGQSNYAAWLAAGPGRSIQSVLDDRREALAARVREFDAAGSAPRWSAPYLPLRPRIPCPTTLVVITDAAVASSGEGFLSFLRGQVDDLVVVGENTRGALTFGHTTAHRLPHSGLLAILPVKLNVPLDLVDREGQGFMPDYWVPAADALNHAVAAVRAGTIATRVPLPPTILDAEFVPESPPWFFDGRLRRYAVIAMCTLTAWLTVLLGRHVRRKRRASRTPGASM